MKRPAPRKPLTEAPAAESACMCVCERKAAGPPAARAPFHTARLVTRALPARRTIRRPPGQNALPHARQARALGMHNAPSGHQGVQCAAPVGTIRRLGGAACALLPVCRTPVDATACKRGGTPCPACGAVGRLAPAARPHPFGVLRGGTASTASCQMFIRAAPVSYTCAHCA